MEKKRKKRSKKVKNNKGFTLIEIIGVVIILGIVTGIGAIAVQGYIHETKTKTYESYKQGLKGASEDLLIDCMNNNEEGCEVPQKGRDLRLGYQELVEKGYSKRLKDPEGEGYCDKSYVIASNESENGVELKYKVCLYCSKYKSTESGCREVDTSDKTRPTCGTTKGESTEWSKENKVIIVGCKDTGGSGCRYPEFSKSIGKEEELNRIFGEQIAAVSDKVILIGEKRTRPIYEGLISKGFKEEDIYISNDVREAYTILNKLKGKKEMYALFENDLPDTYTEK